MHQKLTWVILIAVLLTGCGAGNDGVENNDAVSYALHYDEKNTVAEAYSYESESPENGMGALEYTLYEENALDDSESRSRKPEDHSGFSTLQFTPRTDSVEAEDGTTLLYESYCDAEFAAQDPEVDAWVNSQLEEIELDYQNNSSQLLERAQEYYRDQKDIFYTFSNYLNMGIARHDDHILSILVVNSAYSGGAHPITLQTSFNLDMKTKECLKLEDIVEESAIDEMHELLISGLKKDFSNLGGEILYDDYMDIVQNSMEYGNLTQYWYFNHNGIVIYYNQYEIAPYAAGIIKVEIPYRELKGILKEEYFPEACEDDSSDVILKEECSGCQKTPVQVGEGSSLMVGAEGSVHQVQLSEITWLDGTPVSKRMLLSVSEMDQDDLIEITGEIQDDNQSLSIEFQNGDGESKIYYIKDNKLSEKP